MIILDLSKAKVSKIGEEELCENMENETVEKTGEYSEQIDAATSLDFINIKKLVDNIDIEGGMENQLYSPKFSAYLLNNWTGLASF